MKKIELLSPAGNMECLKYAVMAGCDAVYLAGKSYGARAYSTNFSNDELIKAIEYCHLYGVKVYVTCNTLVYDYEVNDFLEYVKFLHKINADAVLIQDLGMLDLVRKTLPNLQIHSSTQMHIHNLDGTKLMESLGVKRVVLARETSIDTIKYIKDNTKIELEVFVHGSLCVSYSGQCLMSYFNGTRSGNRGTCTGCCRLPYKVCDNDKVLDSSYPLSTKDLNSLEYIGKLTSIGVNSLKIEGRMKSKEYVYLVTKLYRLAIDSYYSTGNVNIDYSLLHDLMKIFNRDYTKGYLFNEVNIINGFKPNNQGILVGKVISYNNKSCKIKLSDTLNIGDGLRIVSKDNEVGVLVNNFYKDNKLVKTAYKNDIIKLDIKSKVDINSLVFLTSSLSVNNKIKCFIEDKPRKVKIYGKIICKIDKPLEFIVSDGINSIDIKSETIRGSIKYPTSKDIILDKLNKLGNTIYEFESIKIDLDDNVFIPLKLLNDIRRDSIELLSKKRLYSYSYIESNYYIDVPNFKKEKIKTCLIDKDIPSNIKFDKVYSRNKINNTIYKTPEVIDNYNDIDEFSLISEVGALYKLHNVDSDTSLNVVNSYSVAFLHSLGVNKVTLSYELNYNNIKDLINSYINRYNKLPNVEVVVYSHPVVMISKYNMNKRYNKDLLYLKGLNTKYKVINRNNLMYIYDTKLTLNTKLNYYDIGVNSIRYNFD